MDGGSFVELKTLEAELVSGFRPGGNPRYTALASIAAKVAGGLGMPSVDVLRFLVEEGRYLPAAEKFVSQLQYLRPVEPITPAARRRANLKAIDALDRPMGRAAAEALYQFTGWGGLSLDAVKDQIDPKYRQSSLALLHEWYTPTVVSDAVANLIQPLLPSLANRYGIISALEPSAGVGRFVDSINRATSRYSILWTAVELNPLSANILHKLHPSTRVYIGPYEAFNQRLGDREYDLVISNPPFGSSGDTRRYAMLDPVEEFMDSRDFAYFMKRSIHALGRCGVGVFLVPRRFMSGTTWETKLRRHVFRRTHLLTAFRLPSQSSDGKRLFPAMETVVDVVVVRSRGGTLRADAPDDKSLIEGLFFRDNPDQLLGEESRTPGRNRYRVVGDFYEFPEFELRPECTSCETRKKTKVAVVAQVSRTEELEWASAIGLRVKSYLAALGGGQSAFSWAEVQTGVHDVKKRHGNPWAWPELRELADEGDQGALSLLRAFTKSGELVAALRSEPEVEVESSDPLVIADSLARGGTGISLEDVTRGHKRGGGKKTPQQLQAVLTKAGYVEFRGKLFPRTDFLAGDLWEKYDELPEGDPRRQLLLDTIQPAVFEDIEFDPRQSWIPADLITAWLNEDDDVKVFGVFLTRDKNGDLTAKSGDGDHLYQIIPWLNHRQFFPYGRPKLPVSEIPDELIKEIQRLERLGERITPGIRRKLWELFWLRNFLLWLTGSKPARKLAVDAYNRNFKRFALPQVDDRPLEIHRWTKDPKLQLRPHQVKAVKARVATKGGVLALAVGAGKTFTSLAIVALGRQQGWIKRPVIVVPTSIVWQWYEEVKRVLPDYRVGVVGSVRAIAKSGPRKGTQIIKTATAIQRSRVWLEFQAGLFDLVLLTDTSLDRTKIANTDLDDYNGKRSGIRRSIQEFRLKAAQKDKQRLTERDRAFIENASAAWSERVLKNSNREFDPGVEWSDLGIDFFVWDETGNIRNTWSPSPGFFGNPKYMGTARGEGAQRAWQADYRAHSVRRRGGGVLGLSGTVGENSPAEVYNLLHFIDPRIMEGYGILNIEEFISRYVIIKEKSVVKPTGERAVESAVMGYKNLNELRHILFRHGSFVSHEEAGIKLPESQELLVEVEMGEHQRDRYDKWRDFARDALEEGNPGDVYAALNKMREITVHPSLGLGYDWDTALGGVSRKNVSDKAVERWLGDGWLRSINVLERQLANPKTPNREKLQAKLERLRKKEQAPNGDIAIEKLLPRPGSLRSSKFNECARRITGNRDCGHVVFVESTAAHRWLIEVLVADGIKRERIAVINGPAKPDVERIASKFNGSDTEPRSLDVVIANSKGARGVNLQREACMLHNLDLRWTPADMEQRRGRIDRFGNTMPVISIIFYFAKDSFDAFMFDILSGKGNWRDSLFLREGDRSINPAAQLDLDEGELLLLTARSKEEGLRLKAELEARKQEEELERAGVAAVKNFQRAAGRLLEASQATGDERERLRGEARDILDMIAKIDDRAWPYKQALEDLWNGDPEREWLIVSAKAPPVYPGMMVERTTSDLIDDDEGKTTWKPTVIVEQIGALFGNRFGVRENGTARWQAVSNESLKDYRYTEEAVSDELVSESTVVEHWTTWRYGDSRWVMRMWKQFAGEIFASLKSGPHRLVPYFTPRGLEPRTTVYLEQHELGNVLPPTHEAFRTFEAWAPVLRLSDSDVFKIGWSWFGRNPQLESRALYRTRRSERVRLFDPGVIGCDKRVVEINPRTFAEQIAKQFELVRDTKGIQTIELLNDVSLDVDVAQVKSPDELRVRVLTTLYRDFADRWFRLRVAQQRHLAGEVDRVLPEYYKAIRRAHNRVSRVLGHRNAALIQVCAQFAAQDHADEQVLDPAKLSERLQTFVAGTTRLRVAHEISFVPLDEHQTLTLKSIGIDEGPEETLISAKGHLFQFELGWKLDLTLPAVVGKLYRVSIEEHGNEVNAWIHVYPDSATDVGGRYVD